jgi:LmbE family N-acetylglucosaminyl deacetylase
MKVRWHHRRQNSRKHFPAFPVVAAALLALAAGMVSLSVKAQAPPETSFQPSTCATPLALDRGGVGLWQTLKRLRTRASILQITAHPDDEDGPMLTYQSRGQGTRAAILCLTRGEGGANVMSQDYFDAIGLVRTEELLMAGRYYGVQLYWGIVNDYGFSKTKEEALDKWTHDRVLGDAVRVVRMMRPLVVTSVFVGGPTDGHGNHQTCGQIMQEVFMAAGDPNAYPEQIKEGLRPWSPLKAYGRTPMSMRAGAAPETYSYIEKRKIPAPIPVDVTIPGGTYDPVLGYNYSQIAREGLGFQKCQNGGTGLPPAGEAISSYTRYGSKVASTEKGNSFFDGIDVSLQGIATLAGGQGDAFLKTGLGEITALVERAIDQFSVASPEKSAPALAAGLKATQELIQRVESSSLPATAKMDVLHELQIKRVQFNEAIVQALGLSVEANVTPETVADVNARMAPFMGTPETFQIAIPGQKFWVNVHVVNQGKAAVRLQKVALAAPQNEPWIISDEGVKVADLASNKPANVRFTVNAPDNAGFTRPYFSRPNIEQAFYDVNDKRYQGLTHMPYPLSAWVDFTYEGAPVRMGQVVQTVKRVTGPGLVQHPLVVAPAIAIKIAPHAGIIPLDAKSITIGTTVHSNVKGPAKGKVRLELPEGWTAAPASADFSTQNDGEDQSLLFTVIPKGLQQKSYKITATAEYNGRQYREGYQTTGYQGLRPYYLYRASTYLTSGVDVKVAPSLTVGYIMGSGDEVSASMENLGIKAEELTSQDLASGDLAKFKVILMGVRTYAVREDLKTYNQRILDYVKNGGVAIVQYNTPEFDNNYGPYPYTMGRNPEEVTDEFSTMQILNPKHLLFNWPNRITAKDFEGWVEERGSKFMQSWDSQYEALLETHDAGQEPQKGGLLFSRYGKGIYVYCAYAFYRQLPEGVPGAYRLFANLVSLPDNPQRAQK